MVLFEKLSCNKKQFKSYIHNVNKNILNEILNVQREI